MKTLQRIPVLWFGAGSMTRELLPALRADSVEILAFIDERREMRGKTFCEAKIISLEEIANYHFSYILVGARPYEAIADKLIRSGVGKEKIVSLDFEAGMYALVADISRYEFDRNFAQFVEQNALADYIDITSFKNMPWYNKIVKKWSLANIPFSSTSDIDVTVKIVLHGGFGDALISMAFVKELYKTVDTPLHIDIFLYNPENFHSCRYVRNIYEISQAVYMQNYDICLEFCHILLLKDCRIPLQHKKYAVLREIVHKITDFSNKYKHYVGGKPPAIYDGAWARLCTFMGWNRWDELGASGAAPFSRKTRAFVPIDAESIPVLQTLGLKNTKYVTVHAGIDGRVVIRNASKVWPEENWREFCRLFKKNCPDIPLVQLGLAHSPRIAGADICLLGKTSLAESTVLLKHALLHVDGESGLVHLRRQLGGKSVALFGPTPVEYFGYPENVNIVAEVCGDCMWMTEDWYVNCLKGLDKPACLESIRAETVLRAVRESLDGLESYNCSILDAALYSSAGRAEYEAVFADICRACGLDKKPISENILGESGVYVHASKQWEYPYVVSQIRQLGSGLKIADVGGGRGALAWYLAASGQAVTVYDLDFSCGAADAYAGDSGFIRFAARQGFTAEYGSIFNLPADDNAFDVVACVSVIEHVHHKEYALKELLRVLKPGGRLILTYDLAGRPETLEDDNRVEIFSPAGIADLLKNFGADAGEIHSRASLDRSLADIQGDAVADIPPGMTVGALALVKFGGRA